MINKMDKKEFLMFNHFKRIIERRKFDEYDIYGFLIFVRRHAKKEVYHLIHEFSELVVY